MATMPSALADSHDAVGIIHDFSDGDAAGWHAYANAGSVSTSTDTEEFCATASGGENPWDIAAQLDDVLFERGATYAVSFDVHASAPVTVPFQGGAGYPAVFMQSVTVDGTATPQHVQFTFAPDDWATVADNPESPLDDSWTEATGPISFQLGAQAETYTLCFDNFRLQKEQSDEGEDEDVNVGNPAEQVVGGDFEDGELAPFYAAGTGVDAGVENGVMCARLDGGTSQRWDQMIGFNGIVLEPDVTYTLSFDASSSTGRPVRVVIGEDAPPHTVLFEQSPTLSEEMENYSYTFTPEVGFTAADGEGLGSGELSFQVGGAPEDWTFCLDNVSFLTGTERQAYAPETGPRVRVNQVGYLPDGPKRATLVTDETSPVAWELVNEEGTTVSAGVTEPAGIDETAGLNVHVLDFGSVTEPGTYSVRADGEQSYDFAIAPDLYQQLRYDAINYFYPARSGIAIDGSVMVGQPDADQYTREAGHVGSPGDDSVNQGDWNVPCLTPEAEGEDYWMYDDWTCNYTADVVGGWYDAGDHGKYVVNGGISVAQLLSTYERTLYTPTGADADLGDGTLNIPRDESSNGVPDVLDEARWQLEWMMKMQVPATADMYPGMVHHKIADLNWTGLPLMPADDPQERYLHRPSTAATLNFAAVAAQGSRLWESYDPTFAAELLAAGKVAWEAAHETPDLYAPAPNHNPSAGSGPYDDDKAEDEFYWAAAEMFLTTGDSEFRDYVLASDYNTADIWSAGGFNWFETAALGRISLAIVESDIPGRADIRQSVVDAAERYLGWQSEQPFGTAYPGVDGNYDWGSNSSILNNQVVLGTAFDLTSDQRFADGVLESMDYLLGRNALNNSYITGYGHQYSKNQHSRWFANSLEPSLPNPPRGSVSGGPNSMTETWDPVIKSLYNEEHPCAPQFCYVDDIQSWATNEITVNWNSALTWVASFVADQAAVSDQPSEAPDDRPAEPDDRPAEPDDRPAVPDESPADDPTPAPEPDEVADDADLVATGSEQMGIVFVILASLALGAGAFVLTLRRRRMSAE
ncbi:glycoside hydrolase family 9 protein [Microbacterium amylolyticum]|uniref:Endoglucanase n=1 Tax=Microbacterium amylolyticum TaxID=936337 RepID=A0ABS4ZIG2_9MICO|nr:glycoside hydrolase family 9 protein [Microbacterium amylolyticum]MBP2437049.1 endoglucanase [Microbacterium amylolyticum]